MRSSMKTSVEMPTKLNEKITEKDIMILTKLAHSSRGKISQITIIGPSTDQLRLNSPIRIITRYNKSSNVQQKVI